MATIETLEENKIRIVKRISNLISSDNSFLRVLEEKISSSSIEIQKNEQERSSYEAELNALFADKKILEKNKVELEDYFKKGLVESEEFAEFLKLIETPNKIKDFSDLIFERTDERLSQINERIAELQTLISNLGSVINDLSALISDTQKELSGQKANQEKLSAYIQSSLDGELNSTPKTIESFIKILTNVEGEPLFEDSLLATEIVMFWKNHLHLEKKVLEEGSKKGIKDIITDALNTSEEEIDSEQTKNIIEPSANIEVVEEVEKVDKTSKVSLDIKKPDDSMVNKLDDFLNKNKEKENENEIPSKESELIPFDEFMNGFNFNNFDKKSEVGFDSSTSKELIKQNEGSTLDSDSFPSDSTSKEQTFEEKKKKEVTENIEYLKSIGVTGEFDADNLIYYGATKEDIKQRIEIIRNYGADITKLSASDIKSILRLRDIEYVLNYAVEHGNEDYIEALTNTPLTKMITRTVEQIQKDQKNIISDSVIEKYGSFKELINAVDMFKDDPLLSPDEIGEYNSFMEQLINYCDGMTRYAYVVNGEYLSKQRVENVAKKIIASHINMSKSDLIFFALVYNSTKNEHDMDAIAEKVLASQTFGGYNL